MTIIEEDFFSVYIYVSYEKKKKNKFIVLHQAFVVGVLSLP